MWVATPAGPCRHWLAWLLCKPWVPCWRASLLPAAGVCHAAPPGAPKEGPPVKKDQSLTAVLQPASGRGALYGAGVADKPRAHQL